MLSELVRVLCTSLHLPCAYKINCPCSSAGKESTCNVSDWSAIVDHFSSKLFMEMCNTKNISICHLESMIVNILLYLSSVHLSF